MRILILSLIFLGLYWASSFLLNSYIFRLNLSRTVMRISAYLLSFVGILLFMWWGYAPNPLGGFSWFRWVLWVFSALCFGTSTSLLGEVKRSYASLKRR